MNIIDEKYNSLKNTSSDINEHLPVLLEYGKQVKTIAEFGTRFAVSSYAFAKSNPQKLVCVDLVLTEEAAKFCEICRKENVNVRFDVADTTKYTLEQVDLLFIDTLHSYCQVKKELALHNIRVNRYIIFHDTISYGFIDDEIVQSNPSAFETDPLKKGLVPAIMEFLQDHREWYHVRTYPNNNGLTILERR